MKQIVTNIFLLATFAVSPLAANAQTADDGDSLVAKKKVHVAFRDKDADHLLGGISYVDMEELSKKDYTMSSLEDMYALVGGWNGNNLWGMDNERLDNNDNSNLPLVIIDGVKRPSNNVLPSEIEQVTFLKGAQAVVLYGAKGAKGAILITTKRGKVDGLQITANANTLLDGRFTPSIITRGRLLLSLLSRRSLSIPQRLLPFHPPTSAYMSSRLPVVKSFFCSSSMSTYEMPPRRWSSSLSRKAT